MKVVHSLIVNINTFLARDLLIKLLEPNPEERISLIDALSHEWLMQNLSDADKKDLSECLFR